MKLLLIIFYVAVFAFMIYKSSDKSSEDTDGRDIDFVEAKKHIEKLKALENRLEQVENLITDIECCSPEKHQAFIHIVSGTREIELHIDGENQTTQNLLQTLYAEREKLRTSLLDEIRKMGGTV